MAEQTIRTVLVDDSENNLLLLENQLLKSKSDVEIIGTAKDVDSAVKLIDGTEPELVFLDIRLPDGDGFDVLNRVAAQSFQVIFVTAYDEYAIKAFEFSALHYLRKPIQMEDLKDALVRFENRSKEDMFESKLNTLSDNLNSAQQKIILPSSDGLSIIELDDIIYCESSNNYTTFFLSNNEKIMVSKPISNYEKLLADLHFSRVHNKYLVNLKYIRKYVRGRGGYIVLMNDSHLDVSEGRKKAFLGKLKEFARN